MSRHLSIGDRHAGTYCGGQVWNVRQSYRRYGLSRRLEDGFSLGPVLFWKERF